MNISKVKLTSEKTEGAIKNGQSRDTDTKGKNKQKKIKKKQKKHGY